MKAAMTVPTSLSRPHIDLPRTATWPWLAAAGRSWLVILTAAATAWRIDWWPAWILAAWVIGNRQHALSMLLHDGAHHCVARSRWLNDLLTILLCCIPLGLSLALYRRFHFQHHRLVGTAKDPELLHKRWAAPAFDTPLHGRSLLARSFLDLCGGGLPDMLRLIVLIRRGAPPLAGHGPGLVLMLLGAGCIWSGWWWVPALWLGALISGYWTCFRWRIWFEHAGIPGTWRVAEVWWMQLLCTPHHAACHWEHHRSPGVPCCALARLRATTLAEAPVLDMRTWWHALRAASATRYGQPG